MSRERKRTEDDARKILARMRAAMEARDLSQADVAGKLDCSQATVSEWFRLGVLPKAILLARFLRATRTSGSWLLLGEGSMDAPKLSERGTGNEAAHLVGGLAAFNEMELTLATLRRSWAERGGRDLSTRPALAADEVVRAVESAFAPPRPSERRA